MIATSLLFTTRPRHAIGLVRHYIFSRNVHLYKPQLQKCRKSLGPPWKILFFGTDSFALTSLKPLCAKLRTGTLLASLGIVSKRGSLVMKFAETEHLPSYVWPLEDPAFVSQYDLGIVVSFGNLIPNSVIEKLALGCINVHASLLPRWRGAAPIIHAIMNGDLETGVTIMKIKPHRFDIGEIVRQYRVAIMWNETAKEVEEKLSVLGAQLLMECIRDLPRCIDKATPQPHAGVTYAPKILQSMAVVEWNTMTAETVYNLHRALCHVYPLTTKWHGLIVKIHSLEIDRDTESSKPFRKKSLVTKDNVIAFLNSDSQCSEMPKNNNKSGPENGRLINFGSLKYIKKQRLLKVLCADNRYIVIDSLSVSGKKMKSHDFYNGFLSKKDESSWNFSS